MPSIVQDGKMNKMGPLFLKSSVVYTFSSGEEELRVYTSNYGII